MRVLTFLIVIFSGLNTFAGEVSVNDLDSLFSQEYINAADKPDLLIRRLQDSAGDVIGSDINQLVYSETGALRYIKGQKYACKLRASLIVVPKSLSRIDYQISSCRELN